MADETVDPGAEPFAATAADDTSAKPRGRTRVIDAPPGGDTVSPATGGTPDPAVAAQQADADGEVLAADQVLDPDLIPLADTPAQAPTRVTAVSRRRPQTVGVRYNGRHKGKGLSETDATVIVPDETNDEVASGLLVASEDQLGPRQGNLHVAGPTYQFKRGDVTQVEPEDVPWLTNEHPLWDFSVVE